MPTVFCIAIALNHPLKIFYVQCTLYHIALQGLSQGADSNGSGVAMLLELMRVFSRLFASETTRPEYNLAFLLTGAGKLNYFGTKRWLEEMRDSSSKCVATVYFNILLTI